MEVPIKPEYGPTLGRLLAPRWRAASAPARAAVIAGAAALLALLVAGILSLLNASYSHGGPIPFSFKYRGLYRVRPHAGELVRLERRDSAGVLLYSFAVSPLRLPPYGGEQTAELPLFATSYGARLRLAHPGLVLRGEGKTTVNTVPAYQVLYTLPLEGRTMLGRDVLLLGERPAAREGVVIAMLTAEGASKQVKTPLEVATTGVLVKPLRSFSLG